MVTDTFPALALALEPGDSKVIERPPRDPGEALLSREFLSRVAFYGALITGATLGACVLQLGPPVRAQTVAFMTLAFAQLFHLANARSEGPLVGRPHLSNPYAIAALVLSIVLQVLAAYFSPLARMLGVVPLDGGGWLVVASFALVPAVVGQAIKLVGRSRRVETSRR